MQKIQASIFLLAMLGVMSFTVVPDKDETILQTVTYGTCGCEGQPSTGPQVELTLQPDHTFHYINASDPSQKLDLKGQWVMHGKKVALQADGGKTNFHKSWKLDKNQSCLVSRKGLNFIRLCDVKACK
jgi:hypothetical protein